MQKKQLEIHINKEFDFGLFISIYPELGILNCYTFLGSFNSE